MEYSNHIYIYFIIQINYIFHIPTANYLFINLIHIVLMILVSILQKNTFKEETYQETVG